MRVNITFSQMLKPFIFTIYSTLSREDIPHPSSLKMQLPKRYGYRAELKEEALEGLVAEGKLTEFSRNVDG